MSQAPHEVYSQELSQAFRRGHPIAVPHPGFKNGQLMRPVSIGDVGYVHPAIGDFIRLFNIHLEPGVNGQPSYDGLPGGEDFVPLPLGEVRQAQNDTPVWVSNSVNHKEAGAEVYGPFFGGSAEFESSSERGAILATPDPLDCYDALHILSYKLYVKAHIESWVHFARARHHAITVEDIILVTGVDRTTSWATASFANTKFQVVFGLRVQFADTGSGVQLASRFSWQNTRGATVNSGPSTRSSQGRSNMASSSFLAVPPTNTRTIPESPDRGMSPLSPNVLQANVGGKPINTVRDQTVFIRHIRAKRRMLWPGLKLEARGKNDDNMDDFPDGGGAGGSGSSSLMISTSPERRDFVDCLEPALDFILQNSSSNIAIAHDNDLSTLNSDGGYEPYITVEDGYGYVSAIDTRTSSSPHQDDMEVDISPSPSATKTAAKRYLSAEPYNDQTLSSKASAKETFDEGNVHLHTSSKKATDMPNVGSVLDTAYPTPNYSPHGITPRQRQRSAALSCAECRHLKLRCSRVFPCNNCVRKGCSQICPNGVLTTGKGNRFILANTEVLHNKIHELASRVRQLEDALRETHAYVSKDQHPLLTDELLQIKRPLEREAKDELPTTTDLNMLGSTPETSEETEEVLDAVGSLVFSDTGKANFFGTTANAWYYLQNEGGDDDAANAFDNQPWLSRTFPWALTVSDTVDQIRAELWNNLPPEDSARQLVDAYYQLAGWMYRPVEPDDLWTNIFNPVYRLSPEDTYDPVQSHRIAVLYLMFALAELLNLERPPYSKEADIYFKLARTALAVDSVLEEQSIQAIQALVLMCHYMFFAEIHAPRWTLMGLVIKLAQSMGLHRDSLRWKIGEDETKKRRALLWEVVTYDSWQSLTYGRPPSMSMVHVDCQFPEAPIKNERGPTDMSFEMWKHRFVENVQSLVHDQAFCAKPASYKVIQELDNKVRTFPFPPSLQIVGFGGHHVDKEPPPFTLFMQRYIAHAIWEITIFYMHRGFFARALEDSTGNPLNHKYSQSVLAASMSACTFIVLIESLFSQYPRQTERMWFLFTHVFSCAVVLGSIAIKCPQNSLSRNALMHVDKAIALYERVTTSHAAKVLPVLLKLRERAINATAEASDSPPRTTPEREEEEKRANEELATLGGKTRLVSRNKNGSTSNPTSPAASGASQKAGSLSPTIPQTQSSFSQGMNYASPPSEYLPHTANSTSPTSPHDQYSQLGLPPSASTSHIQHYPQQSLQAQPSVPYTTGLQPQGSATYPLPGSQSFYQQQSAPVSPVHQRSYQPQPQQSLQQVAYGQPTTWTSSGYEQTASPDEMPYSATLGGAQPSQYTSVNGHSQLQGVYDQTQSGFPQNGQTYAGQEGQWQLSNYSYENFPQQTQQGQGYGAQGQYGQPSNYDADQAMASGSYLMGGPMTGIDPDASWKALFQQWAPQ